MNTHKIRTKSPIVICALAVIVIAFLWVNVQWLRDYRFDQSLDIDEAGYITYATVYARSLIGGGINAWLHAINGPGAHGPVVPAISSLILAMAHLDINYAFLTNPILGCIVLLLTYAVTRKISNPQSAALIATLIVATTPGFVDYARAFQFAMQAAVCYIIAAWAVINSNSYTSKRFAVIAGMALGFMIMSRTMTIAFLPAFALASLGLIFMEGNQRNAKTWTGVAIATCAFFLTALTWYAQHYKDVFEYLFSFGYGAHASEYGKNTGFLTIDNLKSRVDGLMVLYLRPLHFYILLVFAISATVAGLASRIQATKSAFHEQRAFLAILIISSLVILGSSRNRGSGFEIPILAPLVALLAGCFFDLLKKPAAQAVAFGVITAAIAPVAYSHVSPQSCTHLPKHIWTPFGMKLAFECRGTIHEYIAGAGIVLEKGDANDTLPLSQEDSKAWAQLSKTMAQVIRDNLQPGQGVAFGTRNYLFNVNTVSLAEVVNWGRISPKSQIDPNLMKKSIDDYEAWVKSVEKTGACAITTSSTGFGEFNPKPSIELLTKALQKNQYTQISSTPTPISGQFIIVWKSPRCETPF
jgi:hypothetical protein